MERVRATFIRFLFCFIGGADNRRRGQREEWTAGVVDSEEDNGRGQREVHEEWTARRTAGGASSYKFLKKKLYDFSPQLGPVESSYLLVHLKFVFLCVVN